MLLIEELCNAGTYFNAEKNIFLCNGSDHVYFIFETLKLII
jgi:hypothetical protein